jgi:hypothetical protein
MPVGYFKELIQEPLFLEFFALKNNTRGEGTAISSDSFNEGSPIS